MLWWTHSQSQSKWLVSRPLLRHKPNVAQEIRELMAGIVAKLEPRVIEVEKVVPLEAKAPIAVSLRLLTTFTPDMTMHLMPR